MKPLDIEFEIEGISEENKLDVEMIKRNHEEAALLSKKGLKIKRPMWNGLIAS